MASTPNTHCILNDISTLHHHRYSTAMCAGFILLPVVCLHLAWSWACRGLIAIRLKSANTDRSSLASHLELSLQSLTLYSLLPRPHCVFALHARTTSEEESSKFCTGLSVTITDWCTTHPSHHSQLNSFHSRVRPHGPWQETSWKICCSATSCK